MAKSQKVKRSEIMAGAQAVKVVGYDYDYSDEEIDELIECVVRLVERAMLNPRLARLIALGKAFS